MQTANEDNDSIPLDTQRHLMSHLQLVVELGGRVHRVVSDKTADFCREQQASMNAIASEKKRYKDHPR